jgi:hypothetical protein
MTLKANIDVELHKHMINIKFKDKFGGDLLRPVLTGR